MTKIIRMGREEYFQRLQDAGYTGSAAPTHEDEIRIFGALVQLLTPTDRFEIEDPSEIRRWQDYMYLGWKITFLLFCILFVIIIAIGAMSGGLR